MRRNPKTGEMKLCPPVWGVKFSPSKKLLRVINANKGDKNDAKADKNDANKTDKNDDESKKSTKE
jgi:hypothetical protein